MSTSAKYHGWIYSSFYNGLQKISIPLFGLLSTMLLARKALTKQEMGVWGLFLAITAFIDTVRQGLIRTSLIKFINHSTEEEGKYVLSAAFFLNAAITVFISLVMLVFGTYFSNKLNAPELASMFLLYQMGMLLLIPFSHFESIMYGKLLFKGLFWTYFVKQGLPLLIMATIYFTTGKLTLNMLVIFFNVGILFGALISYIYVKDVFTKTYTISRHWLGKLWGFGKYVFGTNLSTMVFQNADQFLLSSIVGAAFTASQNISLRIINLANIPSQVLGDILFPKSSKSENSNNPELIKYYYEKTVGATLSAVIPIVIMTFILPKFLIFIIAGSKYYDAIPYLQLVSFTVIFLAYLKVYGVIIDSTGRPGLNFLTTTLIAVIQVVFCYFFIKHYALMGAGYALLATHIIGFAVTQYILWKFFKINFINCFKYAFEFYPEMLKIFTEKIRLKLNMA